MSDPSVCELSDEDELPPELAWFPVDTWAVGGVTGPGSPTLRLPLRRISAMDTSLVCLPVVGVVTLSLDIETLSSAELVDAEPIPDGV